jgi:hypothetical protein
VARPPGTAPPEDHDEDHEETTMIANLELPFLEQGSVQFILLGIMILAIFAALWVAISK